MKEGRNNMTQYQRKYGDRNTCADCVFYRQPEGQKLLGVCIHSERGRHMYECERCGEFKLRTISNIEAATFNVTAYLLSLRPLEQLLGWLATSRHSLTSVVCIGYDETVNVKKAIYVSYPRIAQEIQRRFEQELDYRRAIEENVHMLRFKLKMMEEKQNDTNQKTSQES
jgi:hypothetical protein